MSIAVVYYSKSGNTKVITDRLSLLVHGADIIEVKTKKHPSFFKAGYMSLKEKDVDVENSEKDMSPYDTIVFGGPVWAGKANPYLLKFIRTATGLDGKNVVVFTTSSGPRKQGENPLDMMKKAVEDAGANAIESFWFRMDRGKIAEGEDSLEKMAQVIS